MFFAMGNLCIKVFYKETASAWRQLVTVPARDFWEGHLSFPMRDSAAAAHWTEWEEFFEEKKPGWPSLGIIIIIIIHDVVTHHTAQMTKQRFTQCGWEVFKNSSRRWDLVPLGFNFIDLSKKSLSVGLVNWLHSLDGWHRFHFEVHQCPTGVHVSVEVVVMLKNGVRLCVRKGKAVPLQAWGGPEGSRKLRFPDFMTTAQDGGKVVSPTHRPPLPPGNTPGTHFC